MKLTERQKRVVAALHLEADRSAIAVERKQGLREATVRRCLAHLVEASILRFYPFINVYALGFSACSLYFSLSDTGEQARRRLLQHLKLSPRVTWIAEMGGRYQLCVSFLARDSVEVHRFMAELGGLFPNLFAEKTVNTQMELTLFGPKYLGYPPLSRSSISWGVAAAQADIDQTDHVILSGLINQRYDSLAALARQLRMPISTFNWRVKQLKKKGVVVGFVHLLDTARLGMQTYKVLISGRSSDEDLRDRLFAYAAAHPNVTTFIRTIGSWDFELGVEIDAAIGVTTINRELHERFPQAIHAIEIIPQLTEVKLACYPFAPEELPTAAGY